MSKPKQLLWQASKDAGNPINQSQFEARVGGAVARWLVRWTPDRTLQVRASARGLRCVLRQDTVTLTVPLSTQVYKWVPVNLLLGVALRWTSIPSRGE